MTGHPSWLLDPGFAPADRRWADRSGSVGLAAESAGRAAPWGRLEDFDFDEKIVRVRRQIKNLGGVYVFALPKNDRERIIPLSGWDIQVVRRHVEKYPPRSYTLPWEKPDGKPHTCSILFRWYTDDQHVKARNYSETTWKPALAKAGVIAEPARDRRSRSRYVTTRKEGIHQLRHY